MDFLSLNTSKLNKYNSGEYTAYNYMCNNKILAAVFLIVHLVIYQLIGIGVATILSANFLMDNDTINLYSTLVSLSLVCIFYLVMTACIPNLRTSIFKTRLLSYSVMFIFLLALIFANYVGNLIINLITSPFTTSSSNNQEQLVTMFGISPVAMIFLTAILAPIAEEYAYRLGLVSLFGSKRKILSIVISAIIFGLIHFDFQTIGTSGFLNEFLNLFSYIFAGLIFAYSYVRSESILPSMGAHFVNNVLASLLIIFGVAS